MLWMTMVRWVLTDEGTHRLSRFYRSICKEDQWHDAGTNLVSAISEGTIDACITYFILAEVINYLQQKGGPIIARRAYHALTSSDFI